LVLVENKRSVLHRTRWDIMANILSVAVTGKTQTCIMRKCNLSYKQLQAYLVLLQEKELLQAKLHERKNSPEKVYVTTERGRAFLEAYNNLRATLKKKPGLPSKFKCTKMR